MCILMYVPAFVPHRSSKSASQLLEAEVVAAVAVVVVAAAAVTVEAMAVVVVVVVVGEVAAEVVDEGDGRSIRMQFS